MVMAIMRFTDEDVATWRQDGGVLLPEFFTSDEVAAVRADFEKVFERSEGGAEGQAHPTEDGVGRFNAAQFNTFDAIPFDCSPALNLIGVHPQLIAFAQQALHTDHVHLYQCQAWAKFTGETDYNQPFHCDYVNHTLTAPSENAHLNSVTVLCYFSDVTEAHGPMHYVKRTDSNLLGGAAAQLNGDVELQRQLQQYECSSAAPAGSIFPYSIDVYHRATNMTAPHGVRFAVMACFKRGDDPSIGYHAWPFHHLKPWHNIFNHATPEQLRCFGVQLPGDPFWTQTTIDSAQARYPDWNMSAYREALH